MDHSSQKNPGVYDARSRNDREGWFQNLARATFSQGQWRAADQAFIQVTVATQLDDAINTIEDLAITGVEAFNWSAPPERHLRVLHLSPPQDTPALTGIVMLQQGTQLRLEYRPYRMDTTLVAHFGYEREARPLRSFLPHVDPHGGVMWQDQTGQLYSLDMIVRTLFTDLVQANFNIHAEKLPATSASARDHSKQ